MSFKKIDALQGTSGVVNHVCRHQSNRTKNKLSETNNTPVDSPSVASRRLGLPIVSGVKNLGIHELTLKIGADAEAYLIVFFALFENLRNDKNDFFYRFCPLFDQIWPIFGKFTKFTAWIRLYRSD